MPLSTSRLAIIPWTLMPLLVRPVITLSLILVPIVISPMIAWWFWRIPVIPIAAMALTVTVLSIGVRASRMLVLIVLRSVISLLGLPAIVVLFPGILVRLLIIELRVFVVLGVVAPISVVLLVLRFLSPLLPWSALAGLILLIPLPSFLIRFLLLRLLALLPWLLFGLGLLLFVSLLLFGGPWMLLVVVRRCLLAFFGTVSVSVELASFQPSK